MGWRQFGRWGVRRALERNRANGRQVGYERLSFGSRKQKSGLAGAWDCIHARVCASGCMRGCMSMGGKRRPTVYFCFAFQGLVVLIQCFHTPGRRCLDAQPPERAVVDASLLHGRGPIPSPHKIFCWVHKVDLGLHSSSVCVCGCVSLSGKAYHHHRLLHTLPMTISVPLTPLMFIILCVPSVVVHRTSAWPKRPKLDTKPLITESARMYSTSGGPRTAST